MHYTQLQLQQLLQSNEGDTIQQSISLDHLENCPQCQKALSDLAGEGNWLESWADQANEENSTEHWEVEEELIAQFTPGTSDCNITVSLTPEMKREEGNFTTDLSMVSTDFLQPAVHPELLGRLGRYDVERLVGAGGFGIVFKAHDTELRRVVALKVLAPHLMSSGAARRRFARESQAAAAIVHSHVVPIYDVVSDPDVSYLVMQYVSGGSLQERVDKEGPLAVEDVLRIGMQIAEGLSAAHKQGLVHRDVKPGNILLEDSVDRVLISDFGLARTADDANLTRSGVITGTPHYMSPEQATGSYIDARSDLFSLGSVLFFMLTGRPPFRAPQVIAVLNRICTHPHRPVEHVNSSVPLEVAQLIDDLLQKDAQSRPQSADEVASRLQELLWKKQAGNLTNCTQPRFRSNQKCDGKVLQAENPSEKADSKPVFRAVPFSFMAGSILLAFILGIGISNRNSVASLAQQATAFFTGKAQTGPETSGPEEHSGPFPAGNGLESGTSHPANIPNDLANLLKLGGTPHPVKRGLLSSPELPLAARNQGTIASGQLNPNQLAPEAPGTGVTIRSEAIEADSTDNTPKTIASGKKIKEIVARTKLQPKPEIQIIHIETRKEALARFNSSFRTRQFNILSNETQQYVLDYDTHFNSLNTYGDLQTVEGVLSSLSPFDFFCVMGYWEKNLEELDRQIDSGLKDLDQFAVRFQISPEDLVPPPAKPSPVTPADQKVSPPMPSPIGSGNLPIEGKTIESPGNGSPAHIQRIDTAPTPSAKIRKSQGNNPCVPCPSCKEKTSKEKNREKSDKKKPCLDCSKKPNQES